MSTAKPLTPAVDPAHDDPRRTGLLEAALGVFARFGYRKTSMDEVARAAEISRQGLYLHFANKEELFRATVQFALEGSLKGALRALGSDDTLMNRLCGAYDEWIGRFVGTFELDALDVMDAVTTLAGPTVETYETQFLEAVAATMREAGLVAACKPAGLTARQLAENLMNTAVGLKHSCKAREEFREGCLLAVRVTCAPLAIAR